MLDKFILECFQYSVTGRLGHGIVHNLNGPLQILSMQMEMLKMGLMQLDMKLQNSNGDFDAAACREFVESAQDRVKQASDVMARLESMIHVIGYRGEEEKEESQKRPVEMTTFLKDFVEFWHADLYFKHRVEKNLIMPEVSVFAVIEESVVLAMLDGIMAAFIYCIKAKDDGSFSLVLGSGENGTCTIELSHTGTAIPDDLCQSVKAIQEEYRQDRDAALLNLGDISGYPPHLFVALALAAVRSVDAGWNFEIEPQRVLVASQKQDYS